MVLKTITCSGANEHTEICELIKVAQKFPRAEIGVQVSGAKAAFASARYWWLRALAASQTAKPVSVALHINCDWVEDFGQGLIAPEIKDILSWLNPDDTLFIKRVQLNFKIGREKTPNLDKLIASINKFPYQKFILSYNPENAEFINQVYNTGMCKFDLLFDDSHGEGILPESYSPPVYQSILQGYAGGLGPENVTEELWKIEKFIPVGSSFYIDAEGCLKGEDRHFSIAKCEEFLKKASAWDEF